MSKCELFDPIPGRLEPWEKSITENCGSCLNWNVDRQRCSQRALILERYSESKAFHIMDMMMRKNEAPKFE